AMGFTFPVVTLLTFIAGGIGTGVTTLTSHALGRKNHKDAEKMVTHGILLVFIVSAVIAVAGFLSIKPVFTTLGADEKTMPFIREYMTIWYCGALSMALPMMGNGILISLGDSKAASSFMVLGALLNCILDPVMIFGLAGFPAMGMAGAALATVVAQAISALWLIWLLAGKHRLLQLKDISITMFPASCRKILGFALPSSLSMILMPLSSGVLTALISRYGNEAVAAVSAAGRVEMFAFIVPMALGMSLVPFVSQNFGAGHMDRIYQARGYSIRFALIYGALITAVIFFAAPMLARLFTEEQQVMELFTLYLRIVSVGFGMMEVHRYCGFFLTGIHHPVLSTLLNVFRVLVLLLPLSFIGSSLSGIRGIFTGRLISDLVAGSVGILTVSWMLKQRIKLQPQ
ncbi:MAG: MATE family efflux transporter, partial [Fibrobacter sp.]|nr:MATE family efflux transporter [Fibrobacter sp.]